MIQPWHNHFPCGFCLSHNFFSFPYLQKERLYHLPLKVPYKSISHVLQLGAGCRLLKKKILFPWKKYRFPSCPFCLNICFLVCFFLVLYVILEIWEFSLQVQPRIPFVEWVIPRCSWLPCVQTLSPWCLCLLFLVEYQPWNMLLLLSGQKSVRRMFLINIWLLHNADGK